MHKTITGLLMCLLLNQVQAAAVDPQGQRIQLALRFEPPSLNSIRSTDRISAFVLAHVMEGLVRYGENGQLEPAAAQRWQRDGHTLRFFLRPNALWSDGKPVTAHDFVFAWRRVVDPRSNARYGSLLALLRNAKEIIAGEMPPELLGVFADDDFTLRVELVQPVSYFADLTAFMTLYPVRQDFYSKHSKRYAADADKMLFNGPFTLSRWVHGAHLTLTRNKQYWNRQAVRLQEIDIPYITSDSNAALNLFKNDDIVLADELRQAAISSAVAQGYNLRSFNSGSLYYYAFNFRQKSVMRNRALREAITLVVDHKKFVNRLLGVPSTQLANSIYPRFLKTSTHSLQTLMPPMLPGLDIVRAKRALARAKSQLNLDVLPSLSLLVDDAQDSVRRAQYLQFLLQKTLGLQVHIDRQTFKQRIAKSIRGDFDIVASSWSPDFNDALTFADLFASDNSNNRSRYHNVQYDQQLAIAQQSIREVDRTKAFKAMQGLLAKDFAIIPLYELNTLYVQHPRLKGVQRQIFGGDPSFYKAWID